MAGPLKALKALKALKGINGPKGGKIKHISRALQVLRPSLREAPFPPRACSRPLRAVGACAVGRAGPRPPAPRCITNAGDFFSANGLV